MIKFTPDSHVYSSILPDDIKWISVTTLVGAMKEVFYKEEKAISSSKNKKSKWYGINPEDILIVWNNENKRSTTLGHWYHEKEESKLLSRDTVDGLPVIWPVIQDGVKVAQEQRLQDGIYPEHLVYLPSAGVCGQADIVRVQNNVVGIDDHKTSKEISREGYTNWEGVKKKMLPPLQHMEDSHLNHYSIQLSIYMYAILRFNPHMSAGKMTINHVKFEESGKDMWGYPINHLDEKGEPIVESIEVIPVEYKKTEVQKLIDWIKVPENRIKVINSKH